MKKYLTIGSVPMLCIAAALTGCGTAGNLQSDTDFQNRFYVGAGLLASEVEPDTDGDTAVSIDESRSSGGSLTLGYDLNNRFSIEGHLADLGEAELAPEGSVGYQVGGISGLFYALGNAGNRHRREAFSLFGRLGVGALENDAEEVEFRRVNDVHLLAGLGVEYGFENGLAARAELVAHETDAQYAQLGLVYRFGGGTAKGSAAAPVSPPAEPESTAPLPDESVMVEPEIDSPAEPAERIEIPAIVEPADADNDGVVDTEDQCGLTPQGSPVNEIGCEIFNGVVEGVNFQTGSATLTAEAESALDQVAAALLEYPDVKVAIEAHTDNQGDAADNVQLSKRRAIAVARYLVDQGVSGARLRPQAFGESEPRVSNSTAEGRAANRRVEISIFQ